MSCTPDTIDFNDISPITESQKEVLLHLFSDQEPSALAKINGHFVMDEDWIPMRVGLFRTKVEKALNDHVPDSQSRLATLRAIEGW